MSSSQLVRRAYLRFGERRESTAADADRMATCLGVCGTMRNMRMLLTASMNLHGQTKTAPMEVSVVADQTSQNKQLVQT